MKVHVTRAVGVSAGGFFATNDVYAYTPGIAVSGEFTLGSAGRRARPRSDVCCSYST